MSVSYNDDATLKDATWVAVLLSERDVAAQIPINFVTNPAVSLSSACFGNGLYGRKAAAKCISHLLAVGFRRLVLDLYWSVERRAWTFCPVSIPARADVIVSAASSMASRDTETSTVTSTEATSTSHTSQATITAYPDLYGDTVYELGPYGCTDDLDLNTLVQVLVGYFDDTAPRLTTFTNWLVLNLHVAASNSAPTESPPALTGHQLPTSNTERIGGFMGSALRDYLYTPAQLAKDRSNLNESWYQVDQSYMPIVEYYTIHRDGAGRQSTPDGWPSSKFIQLANSDRLLIEYGSIDPQLADYDLSRDAHAIFSPDYMTSTVDISTAANGTATKGCLYKPDATAVSQVNSSWAFSHGVPVPSNLSANETLGSLVRNLAGITGCGISPVLNTTLFGETADTNIDHYRNVSLSSGWAWAVGEPKGAGTGGGTNGEPPFDRCAVVDVTLDGRWRATNCTEVRRAACRVGNSPFTWALSDTKGKYSNVSDACPSGSSFAVPRTGLENHYLYRHLLSQSRDLIDPVSSDPALREVLINFNSIDITSCWVSGGPGAGCPYETDPQEIHRKTVLVAAIAGIVICIITALTFFVKCNANRRNSRRRKRVIEGWEYEGVPS
ncbi:hypothetical protein N7492_005468 [Penicillium capsulatum]|uniref:Maintenance of telomere capping protein 6 n=1 Tax=Penicillium capsulatum TaxID=69766 RepID=A0A9W9I9M4_9EURO|nr:hypothetical protein N7492_005468 [Penicillium capsulatum]KAJ6135431.1 hypothetical protein N7512_000591 [Penicillium capsulatum]